MPSPCESPNIREEARELVMAYGWNSTCYQILNPGISLWFSEARDAVIGYVQCGKTAVVAGAPVCHVERLSTILDEWHFFLAERKRRVCYFGAEERLRSALTDRTGFSRVILGAQPVWSASQFQQGFSSDRSLRYQLSRARNKGVVVEEWQSSRAAGNDVLKRILAEWLQTRGLPPMHFMVEPFTLDCLADRRLFVAIRAGEPVGFVVLAPVPDRNGWLTEQFVRGFRAPNGVIELLLTEAISRVSCHGEEFITMGIVPLSNHGWSGSSPNPKWLNFFLKWFRAHGRRFYNFDGLDSFKSKFHPAFWEPIYAISMEEKFTVGTLYSIASAFSQDSPVLTIAEGVRKAVGQELDWAIHRG